MLFGISLTIITVAVIIFLVGSFFAMLYFRGHRHAYRVTHYRILLVIYFAKHLRHYFIKFLRIVIDDYRTSRRKKRTSLRIRVTNPKSKKPPS
jgi:hypothetical protein